MIDKVRSAVFIALLAAVAAVFFGDVVVGDRVLITSNTYHWLPWLEYAGHDDLRGESYRTDAARTYLPRRVHAGRNITSGDFPLWNPHILGGSPFFADPQSGVIYPSVLLLSSVDPARGLGYDVALHFFLAMLGMFLFLGAIGANSTGRMVGALGYGLSSFFFLRVGHPTFVAAAAWLPYFFYAYEHSRHSVRSGVLLLAVFLSLGYLAGMPQVFLFGVAALFVYAAFDGIESLIRHDRQAALRSLKVICLGLAIALLAVAVQLVPFIEFVRNSRGLGFTFDTMSKHHLWPPVFLLRTAIPDLFGNPVEGTSWIGLVKGTVHPYNSGFMVYCGSGGLALGLASLVFLRRSRHTRALFGLLVLSVAVATSAAVLRIIYAAFPPAAYSQIDRVSVISCFALAALAGKGISLACAPEGRGVRTRFALIPAGVAAILACGLALFGLCGTGWLGGLAESMPDVAGEMWFRKSGFRLIEWLSQGGDAWFAYERGHIGLGAAFAASSALWTWCYLGCCKRLRRRHVAAWLLGLTLVFDLGLAARRYYVTQPSDCLAKTEGIENLSGLMGEGARWRMGNPAAPDRVLPANTPQIYGLSSFGGLNAMYPSGYADRLAFAASVGQGALPVPPVLGPVGNLMGVRYLVTDRAYPELADSPVMKAVVEDPRLNGFFGLVEIEGDRRAGLLLRTGETCSLNVTVPDCRYLAFSLAVEGDAGTDRDAWPAAVTGVRGNGGREVWLRSGNLDKGNRHWEELRLDVSDLAGTRAWVIFRVPGDATTGDPRVAWSRFEFVKCDCEIREVAGGYEVGTGGTEGTLALQLESHGEFPIRIGGDGRPDQYRTRFVRFPEAGGPAYVLLEAGCRGEKAVVMAEEDFDLVGARLIDTGSGPVRGLVPVYDDGILIYENPSALPRGICVGRELFTGYGRNGNLSGVLETGSVIDGLGSHICGLASIGEYEDERIVMEVVADKDCMLLVQDTWYPGWRASVDGAEAPVLRTDLGIRAVAVDRGRHRVVMEYAPASLKMGLALSIIGIALGVVFGAKAKKT